MAIGESEAAMTQAYNPDLRSRVIKAAGGDVGPAGCRAVRRRCLDDHRVGEALPATGDLSPGIRAIRAAPARKAGPFMASLITIGAVIPFIPLRYRLVQALLNHVRLSKTVLNVAHEAVERFARALPEG